MANTANIKAVITAEDRASGVLHGFSDSVDKVGHSVATTMKRAAVAFGAAASAATLFAVKSAADFEQTRIGLENMLGSADAAQAMLAKVSKFAAETPFEFPELAQATRQLVAFGFTGEDAFKTMTQLGDVSAAIGAPINDLAYLMGTLKAQGRAFTIDIRQFAQRGIPIYEYLARVLKTDTKELTTLIETGKVGFPEVQKAFEMMTAEGGKFHGTMAKQSQSLTGLFSTLKDTIGMTARELVGITAEGDIKEGSLFDNLRKGTAWLIDNLPVLIEQFRLIYREIVPQIQQWANTIAEVARQVGEYLWPKLQALGATVRDDLAPVFERFWKEIIVPLIPVIGTGLVGAIGVLIDVLRISGEVQGFVMRQLLLLKDIIVLVARGAVEAFQWVGNKIQEFKGWWESLPGFIRGFASAITDAIQAPFKIALGGVRRVIGDIKGAISSITDTSQSIVSRVVDPLGIFRAKGGPVSGGSPYIVGEKGPELFVPGSSGNIVPNHQLGGGGGGQTTINMNVNVGMYAGTEMEKRKMAESLMRALKDVADSRNMTLEGMLR